MISCMSWLVPAAGPVRDRLAGVIAGLAAEHGAPVFAPHVTMAGVAEAEPDAAARVLERVVAGVPPFEVTLTGFGYEPEFFRSLYLRAEPSARLTALHEAGQRAWDLYRAAVPAAPEPALRPRPARGAQGRHRRRPRAGAAGDDPRRRGRDLGRLPGRGDPLAPGRPGGSGGLAFRGFSPLPPAAGAGYAPFQWQRTACPLPSQRRPAPALATRTRVHDSRAYSVAPRSVAGLAVMPFTHGGQTRADPPGRNDHDSGQGEEDRHPPADGRDRRTVQRGQARGGERGGRRRRRRKQRPGKQRPGQQCTGKQWLG